MASTQANVLFNGINMEACLQQGLTITGNARCPYCQQDFSFQLYLRRNDGLTDAAAHNLDPAYEICINFFGDTLLSTTNVAPQKIDDDGPCVPCRGCVMNCPKLANR